VRQVKRESLVRQNDGQQQYNDAEDAEQKQVASREAFAYDSARFEFRLEQIAQRTANR
jgi:hypothetical protein